MKNLCLFEVAKIGDSVVTFPIMKALREHFVDYKIIRIVDEEMKDLFYGCPWIDDLVLYRRKNKITLFENLNRKCNIFINLHVPSNFRNRKIYLRDNFFSFMIGARRRIAYCRDFDCLFLTDPIKEKNCPDDHMIKKVSVLVKPLGVDVPFKYVIWTTKRGKEEMKEIFLKKSIPQKRLIVINPLSKQRIKDWQIDKWIRLTKNLNGKFPSFGFVFIGSYNDKNYINDIQKSLPFRTYSLAGDMRLYHLVPLFTETHLFITVDTGPLHIAAATGVRTVALFGSNNPSNLWQPYMMRNVKVVEAPTISEIPLNTVMRAIQNILST